MMRRPRPPVFLERRSYRQRRLRDAAQVLPVLGMVLWALPLLFGADGTAAPTSRALLYIFGVWVALVLAAAALSRALDPALDPVDPTDDPADDRTPAGTLPRAPAADPQARAAHAAVSTRPAPPPQEG